jgi:hypothetical protein
MTEYPTPTCKRILALLRENGIDVPEPDFYWRIRRTNAGNVQRSAGALSWWLHWTGPVGTQLRLQVGGYYPAAMCARKGATVALEGTPRDQTWIVEPPDSAKEGFRRVSSGRF